MGGIGLGAAGGLNCAGCGRTDVGLFLASLVAAPLGVALAGEPVAWPISSAREGTHREHRQVSQALQLPCGTHSKTRCLPSISAWHLRIQVLNWAVSLAGATLLPASKASRAASYSSSLKLAILQNTGARKITLDASGLAWARVPARSGPASRTYPFRK